MKVININNENDFELLREYNTSTRNNKLKIVVNNDIEFTKLFNPIDLENYHILLDGNNHTLKNLVIIDEKNSAGLLKTVNSIKIRNINVSDAYVRGGVMTGSLVGESKHDAIFQNVSITKSLIDAEAYSGGIIGLCENAYVEDSIVESRITGHNMVGGFVGICLRNYIEKNCLKNPSLIAIGNCLNESVGFAEHKQIKTEDEGRKFKRRYF